VEQEESSRSRRSQPRAGGQCRAACPDRSTTGIYKPRRPQETALYRIVRQNLESWLAARREADPDKDPVPKYVEEAFRRYLTCGILCFGFARCRCSSCGYEFLAAFSCQRRGLCPSCSAKYMVRTAAHLVDNVLPRVPYRQWVLALPKRLRYFLHRDAAHAGAVLRIFLRAVETAIRDACPHAPPKATFGAVCFLHRAGSFLNEHFHYHCIITDGLFAPGTDGEAEFFEAADLDQTHIDRLTETLRRRILLAMVRRNLIDEPVALDMAGWDYHGGFSMDASVRVERWDRLGLERVVRYCARPTFAEGRLFLEGPDTVVYTFTRPDHQGRSSLTLTPLELIQRLSVLFPSPRKHRHRYAGVLAPNSRLRSRVISSAGPAGALAAGLDEAARKMALHKHTGHDRQDDGEAETQTREPGSDSWLRASRLCWAMLLARLYEIFPLLCPRCSSAMKVVAFITRPEAIKRILRHLGEPVEPPTVAPARQVQPRLLTMAAGRGPPFSGHGGEFHEYDG
jgi:hypothetical protein